MRAELLANLVEEVAALDEPSREQIGRLVRAKLNAFITVNPKLEDQTKTLEEERQRGSLRPLHCIPVAIKDNFNTKDLPTTGGSVLLARVTPSEDSAAVAKLRAAGALIAAFLRPGQIQTIPDSIQ